MALTAKQQAWIEYFRQGKTAAEAARLAGYRGKSPDAVGAQNLVKLKEYVKDRNAAPEKPRIADMEELNAFWSYVVRDSGEAIKDRLKASELLARAAREATDKTDAGAPQKGAFEVMITVIGDREPPA